MTSKEQQKFKASGSSSGFDAVYGIGIFRAWIYYFKRAATTQQRILAFFKGFVWPALLVYDLMVYLEENRPT